ncbi:MAG: DUF4136 domain-containing protein [Muribaculaceae bacterium]|nr:DUF4136 domain-containing protein [Muribaculaceae bacterium]
MKKSFGIMCVLAVMFLLGGCSPFNLINSTVYNDADLSSYHTFRIITPEEGKLPPGMEMVTYYNIAAAIREQMVERGFTEDPSSPLLINLGLTVRKEIATEPALPPGGFPYGGPYYQGVGPWFMYPRGYYWPGYNYTNYLNNYYSNAQVITGIYREGVLTMDMVNTVSKTAVYSASVGTILENGDSQFRNLEGIAQAVDVLFSKFPVPLLPQYRGK